MWKCFASIIYCILFPILATHQPLTVFIRSFAHGSGRTADQFRPEGDSLKRRAAASCFSLPFLGPQGHLGPGQPFLPLPPHAWSCSCPQSVLHLGFGGYWLPLHRSCICHQVPAPWLGLVQPWQDVGMHLSGMAHFPSSHPAEGPGPT